MSEQLFRREDLLGEYVPRIESYELKDGRTVWVRDLSAKEQGEYEFEQLDPKTCRPTKAGLLLSNARLIVRTVVDGPEGRRIFTKEDIEAINSQPSALIMELAKLCEKHCKINQQNVEEEAKN